MSVLIYLIPIALLLGAAGLIAFLWALKTKQFEDLEGAANRILFDDESSLNNKNKQNNSNAKRTRSPKR